MCLPRFLFEVFGKGLQMSRLVEDSSDDSLLLKGLLSSFFFILAG